MRSAHQRDFPETFLPRRIARAADTAMDDVLMEDEVRRLLRYAGIPFRSRPSGR